MWQCHCLAGEDAAGDVAGGPCGVAELSGGLRLRHFGAIRRLAQDAGGTAQPQRGHVLMCVY